MDFIKKNNIIINIIKYINSNLEDKKVRHQWTQPVFSDHTVKLNLSIVQQLEFPI